MKIYWSPSGKSEVFQLYNPVVISKSNIKDYNSVFIFAPFDEDKIKPILFAGATQNVNVDLFETKCKNENLSLFDVSIRNYLNCLDKAIAECKNESFLKLVVSRKLGVIGEIDFGNLFLQLVKEYPTCLVYFFEIGETVYMGATPEKLLEVNNNQCYSDSLAGTMTLVNGLDIKNWGEKEIMEQNIVSNYLTSAFSEYCTEVQMSSLTIKENGPICHLQNTISGKLDPNKQYLDLLEKLHPTPAVCGFPKYKAKKWILDNESYNREFYTGYIGIVEKTKADFYVNLRCLKSENNLTELYVGGGITKDSVAEKELEETEQKLKVLLGVIKKIHTFVE